MKKQLKKFLKSISLFMLMLVVSLFFSCGNNNDKEEKPINPIEYKQDLEEANKKLNQNEAEDIAAFIKRYGWDMQETGSGLRYYIYNEGKGRQVEKFKLVTIRFKTKLLTGEQLYSSEKDGNKEFILGQSSEISGLEEGLLLMKEGDKAKLIVPSHLAFGLLGDQEKIPMRACLVYDVEVLKVREIE
jgi:FKBP-type peptidyl-prolyl cis-trans isomerase FkpA